MKNFIVSPLLVAATLGLSSNLAAIEKNHPEKMAYVANKVRLFLIREQDTTCQDYTRKHWGKYSILTIISDQFIALFYHWKACLPAEQQAFLSGSWMKENILQNHGPLCSLYTSDTKRLRSAGGLECETI